MKRGKAGSSSESVIIPTMTEVKLTKK
jgi:hypothetical protein